MFHIKDSDTRKLLQTLRQMQQVLLLDQFFAFLHDFLKDKDLHAFAAELNEISFGFYYKGIELFRLERRPVDSPEAQIEIDILELADGLSKPYAGAAATPKGYARHSFSAQVFCRSLAQQQKRLLGIEKLLEDSTLGITAIQFEPNQALMQMLISTEFRSKMMEYLRADSPYMPLIKNVLPTLLLKANIVEIAENDSFSFEHARICWQQILAFEADYAFYERLLNAYQKNTSKYDVFVAQLDPNSPEHKICDWIGAFISYADRKAAGKQHWNKYPDKRCLFAPKVLQHHWVSQLLRYKQSGGQTQVLSANVWNAVRYIQSPATESPILSEKQRLQISQLLLNKNYDSDRFSADVDHFFQSFDLQIKHPENRSHYFAHILFEPALAELWDKDKLFATYAHTEPALVEEDWTLYQRLPAKQNQPLNQILYGPPGTGKTFRTLRLALSIVEGLPETVLEQSGTYRLQKQFEAYCHAGTIAMLSFHQSMSYEDFIEGLKPISNNGTLNYVLQDGIFKEMALRASENPTQAHVLIIDEINRGNVASIFGELISLLEADKRTDGGNALRIQLPYSKTLFSLPPNLYIIGTMNSADRSIEALDTALRRRFSFRAILPQPELLPNIVGPEEIKLSALLQSINQRLELLLDTQHQIGHAYFWEIDSLEALNEVFETRILPLLEEYFYGNWAKIGLILGKGFIEELPKSKVTFADFPLVDKADYYHKSIYRLKSFPRSAADYRAIYEPLIITTKN